MIGMRRRRWLAASTFFLLFFMVNAATDGAPTVSADGSWLSIASGRLHSCAVTTSNAVYCWGWNGEGQLGDNSSTLRETPVKVNGLPAIVSVSAGENFTCAISATGGLYCWGSNSHGQLLFQFPSAL